MCDLSAHSAAHPRAGLQAPASGRAVRPRAPAQDAGVAEIGQALTHLRCLDLSGCCKLGEAALAALAALTRLTELRLCGLSARRVSDGAIAAALRRLPLLEVLDLAFCRQVLAWGARDLCPARACSVSRFAEKGLQTSRCVP